MNEPHSASSQQMLLNRANTDPLKDSPNKLLRDPTSVSAKDVGLNKLLKSDEGTNEQTLYKVDFVNEDGLRKVKRSELASKRSCLTRRWQTALVTGIILVALAAGIGGLAYWITLPKVITQPYLLYGESCYMNSRSCDASRLLWCPAGTCICTGNYYWNTTAQNCSCGASQFWTGVKCQSYGSYGDPCNKIPCLTTLTCNSVVNQTYTTGQAICSCDNSTYLDTIGGSVTYGKCIPRLPYTATCKTNTDCQNWLGLACSNNGAGLQCLCGSTSYWNGSICAQNAQGWQPCSVTIPCDTTKSLTCDAVSSTCQCDQYSFWDNVTTFWCQQKRSYAIPCQYSFQCNTTVNLSCPTVSTACNCPKTSYAGMCDCQLGYFWDGQRCTTTHSFNGTCPGQYACGANLVCYLGHCICPGNMLWGGALCACTNGTVWNPASSTCI